MSAVDLGLVPADGPFTATVSSASRDSDYAYAIAALHESHLNNCRNDHPFDDCPALAAWDNRRKEEDE